MLRRLITNRNLTRLLVDQKLTSRLLTPSVVSTKCLSSESVNEQNFSSSVDDREIRQFRSMSDSWWIENGEFEPLHMLNLLRVPLVRDVMVNYRNSLPPNVRQTMLAYSLEGEEQKIYSNQELDREPLLGLNIIDIGCGGGLFSEPLARLGAQVTAIDACKENIIAAQLRMQTQQDKLGVDSCKFYDRLRYIHCTVEDLTAVEENYDYFDAVVCSEVVEHVNNLPEFISNSAKLLKNQGFAFYTTINRTPDSYFSTILAAEYLLNLVPKGTHSWEKFVKPEELKDILTKNEVFCKFEMGMMYNPLTRKWCWSEYKRNNYALYAQKFKTKID
ncbi:hexaprenyldihydroxybenzoate mitochondrial [Brachionus plicatilis]|uniref:Ubiquinone biosynthesis O-methyltransferase, mitochondrial n=1 Tax=Brachionus plicatilis TaxID=10195 RepID=A0A3M7S0B5_BRAPC|nr:hexaprenyldihydroxybenzoate mitochondrial [Brachionus plicatilis]